MIRPRACPRCRGDIIVDRDFYGWFEQCLQCGYERDFELVVAGKTVSPSQTGNNPDENLQADE